MHTHTVRDYHLSSSDFFSSFPGVTTGGGDGRGGNGGESEELIGVTSGGGGNAGAGVGEEIDAVALSARSANGT